MIDILPEQKEKMAKNNYGGSMRLGAYDANIKKGDYRLREVTAKIKFPNAIAIAMKSIPIS